MCPRRHYAASIAHMDHQIGRVVKARTRAVPLSDVDAVRTALAEKNDKHRTSLAREANKKHKPYERLPVLQFETVFPIRSGVPRKGEVSGTKNGPSNEW